MGLVAASLMRPGTRSAAAAGTAAFGDGSRRAGPPVRSNDGNQQVAGTLDGTAHRR